MTVLMEGIVFGESPRWHDGRVWFSDWGAHQVIALDPGGGHEVVARVPSFPMCIDFLPDGRLLVVDSASRRLLRREPDGSMATQASLAPISEKPWNDIVADAHGNAYVNNIGFDFPAGQPGPGLVALVTPAGTARVVAGDLAFPNGIAITEDGATLIVAESHGNRLTAFDIGPEGDLAGGEHGRLPGTTTRTESAWTPRAPSGTRTSRTATACGCARVARFSPPSNWTEVPSPARSAAMTTHSCMSSARSSAARGPRSQRGRSWCSRLPPPAPAGPSG